MKKLKLTFNAPATLLFVLICFGVTLAGELTNGSVTNNFFTTSHTALTNPITWLRMFTHIFGHSGWDHFIGNAMYLLLLGPMLEEKHGSKVLIEVILITAFITGLANYILFPNVILCGASGVVFAFILLSSFTGFRDGEIPLTFILVAVIYIGQQVYEGIVLTDNISNSTHIIGGLVGSFLGFILNKRGRKR